MQERHHRSCVQVPIRVRITATTSGPAQSAGPVKELAGKLMSQLAPLAPPYEKWFANGSRQIDDSGGLGLRLALFTPEEQAGH